VALNRGAGHGFGIGRRSVELPALLDAARFYRWFLAQKPELVDSNHPCGIMA
jgi:hypothetical protein